MTTAEGAFATKLSSVVGDDIVVSFAGVASLSPSFASALLLVIDFYRQQHPASRVRLGDLTKAQEAIIKSSLVAIRSTQPPQSEPQSANPAFPQAPRQ